MTANGVRDEDLADMIGWSRSIVNRVRKGKLAAASKFIEAVIVATKGEVTADSFFRRALARASAAAAQGPGGSPPPPFNSTSSLPALDGRGRRGASVPAWMPEAEA